MKTKHIKTQRIEIKKTQQTRKFCVKYHPTNAREARPATGALWTALGLYQDKVMGRRDGIPISPAYRNLKEIAVKTKERYAHLGLKVLENGREMFPAN